MISPHHFHPTNGTLGFKTLGFCARSAVMSQFGVSLIYLHIIREYGIIDV